MSEEDSHLMKELTEKDKARKADMTKSTIRNAAIKRERELLASARGQGA